MFSENLKAMRKAKGYTQEELAIGSLIQLVGPQLGGHFIGNFDIFIMGVPRVKVLQIDSSHYIFLRSDFCCGWTI